MNTNTGYPNSVNGPAKMNSPAENAHHGEFSYYEEETSIFPFSCTSSSDCTGLNTHPIPFNEIEHLPYQEIYPYLPPK